MPDKVLFLDFDGVLHPTSHGSAFFSQMNLLEEAIGNKSCQIVISSSWRFHMDLERLRGQFSKGLQEKTLTTAWLISNPITAVIKVIDNP